MASCLIEGTVKAYDGATILPGSRLYVHKVLPGDGSTTIFGTQMRTHTLLNSGAWSPLINIERGAVAYISLNAPGFDRDLNHGTPLQIPDAASATLQSLAAAVSLPSQVPVAVPPSSVAVNTSTRAGVDGLSGGSVAIVTDEERGVWYRYNGNSVKLGGPRLYMKDFAPADGTNQATAINAAIAAAGANKVPIELESGTYGIGSALDGSVDDVVLLSPHGKAIIKHLSDGTILSGAHHGWRFEGIEFQGDCSLTASRRLTWERCVFRKAGNYAIQGQMLLSPRWIDCEFYGTRGGVMTAGAQDPTAVPSAAYGSGLRLQAGCVDVQVVRPKFHFCQVGIGADTFDTQPMRGLYVSDAQVRGDWWNSPFIVGRFTPTAYNTSTRALTASGGGLNALFTGEPLRIVSIPVSVNTGSSFSSIVGNIVTVGGSGFANAQKGDVIETADGKRIEVMEKTSLTVITGHMWESADTFEPTTPPALATAWRQTRYYAAGLGSLDSDTQITLYNDPVNPFSGQRLVADAALSPVGRSCRIFATMIYSGIAVNGGALDSQIRGGSYRGCRADQISFFDTEAPSIIGAKIEYGFDEGITLTRCPRALAHDNQFEQCGVSAVASIDSDYASIQGNVVHNWGTVNRSGLSAFSVTGAAPNVSNNTARVAESGAGSGAAYLIYMSTSGGAIIEGNVDGGARTATLKTDDGPVIARDVFSIDGAGRDNLIVAPGENWSLRTGVVEHFKLDNETGSKLGVTLTNNGTVTFAAGKVGNGAVFDTGKYLSIPDNQLFSIGPGVDFEFTLWLKLTTSADCNIFGKQSGSAPAFEYGLQYVASSGLPIWNVSNGTTTTAVGPVSGLSTGTWYFVRCGWSAALGAIFIQVNNGTIYTTAHVLGCRDGTDPFGIGARGDGYLPLDGMIDEFSFWKHRRLNSDDVTKLRNGGSGLAWPWL